MAKTEDAEVDLGQLQLKLDNPRHEEKEDVPAALRELVEEEKVIELAIDIAKAGGLNPLDRIGVVRDAGSPADNPTFVAAEGNRRVAALMLLDDPERLPFDVTRRTSRLKRLRDAGEKLGDVGPVRVVVFPDFASANPWIDRMHVATGADGARKRWNPTQQARRNGETGNLDAVRLVGTARETGIITELEAGRIAATNVQRVVSSSARRGLLGLAGTGSELRRAVPWDPFRVGLEKLMRDQLDHPRNHDSRALNTADKLNEYARAVSRAMGAPEALPDGEVRPLGPTKAERGEVEEPEDSPPPPEPSDTSASPSDTPSGDTQPASTNPEPAEAGQRTGPGIGDNLPPSARQGGVVAELPALKAAITSLDNPNLIELYRSITTVSARQHPVLVCIGCSTLLELLTQATGWEGNNKKLVDQVVGMPEVKARYSAGSLGSISDLLRGLRGRANLGKHDANTGGVHGDALIKDMATLTGVFLALAEAAVEKRTD